MKALLLIDVQNDFLPGGALAVPHGDEIIPIINELMKEFDLVVASKDWHPPSHASFTRWPVHCVQGTPGAEFPEGLDSAKIEKVFLKGDDPDIDAYSAFQCTGLADFLKERGVDTVYIAGLAREYCVKSSAAEAEKLGFTVHVIEEACRGLH